jgi:uncharacterized protein
MSRDDVLKIVRNFKNQYAEIYGITSIGIFGSYARDNYNKQSDVDICVTTLTPDPFILVHAKEELENRLHLHVDIVRCRESMNHFLKERIDKEVIYV